jgi:hypothetical protein
MLAINYKLPLRVQVTIQEKRLALLQKMDKALPSAGHTQRRLECRDGGASQITGSQEIVPPKRAPSPSVSSNIQRTLKLPRNKLGEADVQALIKASWPTELCSQNRYNAYSSRDHTSIHKPYEGETERFCFLRNCRKHLCNRFEGDCPYGQT